MPQNVTLFIYIGHQVKMKSSVWDLIQCDWYPYKKGEFWTQTYVKRDRQTHQTNQTQWTIPISAEDGHLQPKEC